MIIKLIKQNVTNMFTPIELVTTNVAVVGRGGGIGGVTDHGYLHGLLNNDHPQYQLTANNSVILGPYQLTANNSLSLGLGASASFLHTSNSSLLDAKANSTLYYRTAYNTLANSTHNHGDISIVNIAGSNISLSSASSGVTLSIPNYITTAALSDHSHGPINVVSVAGTNLTAASASNGFTIGVPSFITTAFGAGIRGSGTYIQNTGTIRFSNSNGVTFGLGTDGIMTASIPAVAGAQTGISSIYDGAGATITSGGIRFANSNGISFGLNGSVMTGSYSVPGITLFSNSNNVEFGLNGSTVTALAKFTQSNQTFSNQSSNYLFSGFSSNSIHSDGIAYGLSLTANPNGNVIAVNGSNTIGTITGFSSGSAYFAGGNNITLSQSGNAVTIIGAAQGGVQTGISGIGADNAMFSSGSIIMSGQSNITIGTFATSNSQYVRFSVGNYITTGANVSHTHGSSVHTASTTGTDIKFTSVSNGVSVGIPPYITGVTGPGTSFITQSTIGSNIVGTLNSTGLNLGVPKYLTTGGNVVANAWTVQTHSTGSNISIITGASTNTLKYANFITTAALSNHDHSDLYLTTAALSGHTHSNLYLPLNASTKYVGLATTGITGASATINSSQLRMNIPQGSLYFNDGNGVTFGGASSGLSTTITASAIGNRTAFANIAGFSFVSSIGTSISSVSTYWYISTN